MREHEARKREPDPRRIREAQKEQETFEKGLPERAVFALRDRQPRLAYETLRFMMTFDMWFREPYGPSNSHGRHWRVIFINLLTTLSREPWFTSELGSMLQTLQHIERAFLEWTRSQREEISSEPPLEWAKSESEEE
jgi:hypothetical protein